MASQMAAQAVFGAKPVVSDGLHRGPETSEVSALKAPSRLGGMGQTISSLPLGTWALLDAVLLLSGTYLGFRLFVVDRIPPYMHLPLWQACAILESTFLFAGLVFGLYERETLLSRSRLLTRMMLTLVTAVVITYAIVFGLMYTSVSRRVTACAIGTVMLMGGSARLFACWALHRVRRNVLIVGPNLISSSLARAFREGFLGEYRLVGYVDDTDALSTSDEAVPKLGTTGELAETCRRYAIHDIIVGAEVAMDTAMMNRVLSCLRRGCRVTNEATFYEKTTGQILNDEITPHWFLFADLQVNCQRRQALKRAFDIVAASVSVLVALPVLPVIALLIKLEDGGPVFYTQRRVGQNGKPFPLHKFRTMRVGAEANEPIWATRNDPRATWVGRILRLTHLDELPQLYNVLRGQMSLVGPRPERPDFVKKLAEEIPYYNERHLVKPGLTGWAQIGYHYGASTEDAKRKLQFDLYYLKHMSIELDLTILLRTLGVVMRGAC
ncbi:MAG: sugar transferase [Planctomycetes bacterium]|nr:sugar transferase [Planctomycetota bacterium]